MKKKELRALLKHTERNLNNLEEAYSRVLLVNHGQADLIEDLENKIEGVVDLVDTATSRGEYYVRGWDVLHRVDRLELSGLPAEEWQMDLIEHGCEYQPKHRRDDVLLDHSQRPPVYSEEGAAAIAAYLSKKEAS